MANLLEELRNRQARTLEQVEAAVNASFQTREEFAYYYHASKESRTLCLIDLLDNFRKVLQIERNYELYFDSLDFWYHSKTKWESKTSNSRRTR